MAVDRTAATRQDSREGGCTVSGMEDDPRAGEMAVVGGLEDAGEYAESSSTHAFLRRAWERFGHREGLGGADQQGHAEQSASIFTFGDRRLPPVGDAMVVVPTAEEGEALLAMYFDFAMPCYRYLHRPTVAKVFAEMQHSQVDLSGRPRDDTTTTSSRAVVWMLLATASLFKATERLAASEQLAETYYAAAVAALSRETGRARLESVQARLAVCLYLLHTGRPNEAWHNLGTTVQLAFALGLHRTRAGPATEDVVVQECRKRTLWAVATLDTYMSVMLGRPALIDDREVNQRYPQALDDDEMAGGVSSELVGDRIIQASIYHVKLARIAKRAAQAQSSTQTQSFLQKVETAFAVMEELAVWQKSLPVILSGVVHPSSLIPIFRRQTMVLRLAHAHATMLVTRPLLLVESVAAASLQPCISACLEGTTETLQMLSGSRSEFTTFSAFWFTQYVAFNAVSIAYVWLIQRKRGRLLEVRAALSDDALLREAEAVQKHFAGAVEMNAPSLRYNVVLEELRQELLRLSAKTDSRKRSELGKHPFEQVSGSRPQEELIEVANAGSITQVASISADSGMLFGGLDVDFPFEPDLWLQLDSFPFSDEAFNDWN
ncbi:hypothetical protein B0A54_13544 [Friedmanniomyces endolithicus]|uniref:Xylanolytic transcriptional activator regulatory domain-containing protein n=1 Tax=Friedmanniomyces endolithicus TaxID=329885 RepID=A0A4U0UMS7_9PEZI|nr:hypothetical protein LTS09_015728 [Friedmanniomyces endolithicus]TKA36542.1 hypothetical protein B0A54_13544 [Friedmanniomyces endolithicus]